MIDLKLLETLYREQLLAERDAIKRLKRIPKKRFSRWEAEFRSSVVRRYEERRNLTDKQWDVVCRMLAAEALQ